jgi:hypothetical protein
VSFWSWGLASFAASSCPKEAYTEHGRPNRSHIYILCQLGLLTLVLVFRSIEVIAIVIAIFLCNIFKACISDCLNTPRQIFTDAEPSMPNTDDETVRQYSYLGHKDQKDYKNDDKPKVVVAPRSTGQDDCSLSSDNCLKLLSRSGRKLCKYFGVPVPIDHR